MGDDADPSARSHEACAAKAESAAADHDEGDEVPDVDKGPASFINFHTGWL